MTAFKKILRLPHKFVVKPAPGWSKTTYLELCSVLKYPWGNYKFKPLVEISPTKEITLTNCDFRQGMEVTARLLCAHDVEWVINKSRCKSRGELHRFVADIPFNALVGDNNKTNISVQGHSMRSFVDSSSLLKEEFTNRLFRQTSHSIITTTSAVKQTTDSTPNSKFKLHLLDNVITLSISMAGADSPLFKRGYKQLLNTIESSNSSSNSSDLQTPSVSHKPIDRKLHAVVPLSGAVGKNHAVAPLPEHHAASCFRATIQAVVETRCNVIDSDGTKDKETRSEADHNDCEAVERGLHDLMGKQIKRIYVPYAGTGTLGFEALLSILGVGSGVVSTRRFAFETFPLSPEGTIAHIRKAHLHRHPRMTIQSSLDDREQQHVITEQEASLHMTDTLPDIIFSDINEDVIGTLKCNIKTFCSRVKLADESTSYEALSARFHTPNKLNFLSSSLYQLLGTLDTHHISKSPKNVHTPSKLVPSPVVALLLNPPYGKRLGKNSRASSNYKAIGKRVVEIRDHINSGGMSGSQENEGADQTPLLMGYILCPDESTWSAFMLCLSQKRFGVKTTHFMHGGNDTRLVAFWDTTSPGNHKCRDEKRKIV